jgi:hypothetical protein
MQRRPTSQTAVTHGAVVTTRRRRGGGEAGALGNEWKCE